MSNQIASEILNHLGGSKFIAMTGAQYFADGNTLIVKFKGSKIANIMYITLNSLDLYNIRICKFRSMAIKSVKEVENAYCDMLTDIFESTTKLRTSL